MKKYLLLALAFFSSTSYPFSLKRLASTLVGPIRSVDGVAKQDLHMVHEKNEDASYRCKQYKGIRTDVWRTAFPETDPSSPNRLAHKILIDRFSTPLGTGIGAIAIGRHGDSDEFHSGTIETDYEALWKAESKGTRFWWTIRYRRPYTIIATLGKWGCLIVGSTKMIQKLKARAKNKAKQDAQKATQKEA